MGAEPGRGQEPGVREADPGAVTTAWRSDVSRPAGPAREYQLKEKKLPDTDQCNGKEGWGKGVPPHRRWQG